MMITIKTTGGIALSYNQIVKQPRHNMPGKK